MSQDPKKPFDAPPGQTPDLLRQEIPLDRRNRRVPTFEELRAAPTEPERPAYARPQAIPQATVPAKPRALDASPPTAPIAVPPHLQRARPAAPPAPSDGTNVLPPRPGRPPPEEARTVPPSPSDWARMQGQRGAPLPQVTAGVPSLGASIPPGQAPVARPQALHDAPPQPTHPHHLPPEPSTQPGGRPPVPVPSPQRPASPSFRSLPNVLPPEMLVTQPGLPGPFAEKKRAAQAPAPFAPPPQPAPAPPAEAPRGPTSLAEFASLAEGKDVLAAPAAVWRRLAAWLVDVSLLGGVVALLLVAAAEVIAGGLSFGQLPAVAVPAVLLVALLAFVYATLFAFIWGGRTPGRRLLGLHLVDDSGHAPAPTRALLRGALSVVSFALFLSGFWMALFDRRGQTLHDKLSSTFVVQLRDASGW